MQSAHLKPMRATALQSSRLDLEDRRDEPQDDAREIDLVAMIQVLWRGKWIVFLAMAIGIALAVLYAFVLADPSYTSTAVVALDNRDEQVIDLGSVMSGIGSDQASINTEVEILQSRGLAGKLVDRLDLTADPEFNTRLRPADPWSPGYWIGKAIALLPGRPPAEPVTDERIRQETIDAVLKAIGISNVRQSYVFEITVTTHDAAKSARMANAMADIYVVNQIQTKFEATQKAIEWLSERVGKLKTELESAASAVTEFNTSAELISPERLEARNRQLKEFRDRRNELSNRRDDLDARLAELEAASRTGDLAQMAAVADLPGSAQLDLGPDGSEADRQSFLNGFQRLVDRARSELAEVTTQIDVLGSSIDNLAAQIAVQSNDLLELEQLQREAEATRTLYEYFLNRLKETTVQQGVLQPESRTLSDAVIRPNPSSPRRALALVVAALLGGFIGSAIVLVREARTATYRTAEELERDSGILVIGQVPRAPHGRRKRILDYVTQKPASALVEAIRNLRTSILLANVDSPTKVIMMTSSVPGEGKTTLSMALAHNMATMGRKVLLIEGDLRRRTFREVFETQAKRGIVAAVMDEAPLDEIVHRESDLLFDVLLGERLKINAADFFSSARFARFIERVRQEYDYVIIDTPPVLLVPDARVIGQLADVVVYVVNWNKTLRRQVQQGIHSFATVNVPVSGLVLGQIDPRGMRRYGYGGYAYGKGYGKQYYEN